MRFRALAAAAVLAALASVAVPVAAQASLPPIPLGPLVTDGCLASPYCGTQESDSGLKISVLNSGQALVMGVHSPFHGVTPVGQPSSDFLWLPVPGSHVNAKWAEWAPNGRATGIYLAADPQTHKLVTNRSPGSPFDQLVYLGGCGPTTCDGPWADLGDNRILKATTNYGAVVTVVYPILTGPTADENFTFVSP